MFLAPGVTMKFSGGPVGAGEEKWGIHTFTITSFGIAGKTCTFNTKL